MAARRGRGLAEFGGFLTPLYIASHQKIVALADSGTGAESIALSASSAAADAGVAYDILNIYGAGTFLSLGARGFVLKMRGRTFTLTMRF